PRTPLPVDAPGGRHGATDRRFRRPAPATERAAGDARQRQGLRVWRQHGVVADAGVLGAGVDAGRGGRDRCRDLCRRQPGALPASGLRGPADHRRAGAVGWLGRLSRDPAPAPARADQPGRPAGAGRRPHCHRFQRPLRRHRPLNDGNRCASYDGRPPSTRRVCTMHWFAFPLPRRELTRAGLLPSLVLALATLLVLAGCGSASTSANALDASQYAWSGAIRWGDFGGARNLVDPSVREANPLTELQMDRYEQIQISSYRDVGGAVDPGAGVAVRNIE